MAQALRSSSRFSNNYMKYIELLAPARDLNIGIAAIDCGADAVYIAGEQFGARQAAGNSLEDIRTLCDYAHQFGVRIFVTLNTILYDSELERAYRFMLDVQDAGADAIIVQDLGVLELARNGFEGIFESLRIPLHASTQCAIRTPEQARFLEKLGFSRLILERELSLEQIREIRNAVSCELEFFVHGALCVCYSGQCYLSEMIAGRSANRGACIQACRSRYDLMDASGKVLVKDKALLSLKDYNLRGRLRELAEAGITSFKIEGRLKNESYVRNVVRDYSIALDKLSADGSYRRTSFGGITGGFSPDTSKTFNRGYTELFLDGTRSRWASMDAAKSMGEHIGSVSSIGRQGLEVRLNKGVTLSNGDGFSFVARNGSVEGFRGDVCSGNNIKCRVLPSLFVGAQLYRNINTAFEKEIERNSCTRELLTEVSLAFSHDGGSWTLKASAISEDGRKTEATFDCGEQKADNQDRMRAILQTQIGKSSGHYRFALAAVEAPEGLPFMSTSALNAIRRNLAKNLEDMPAGSTPLLNRRLESPDRSRFPSDTASYKQNISNFLAEKVYHASGADISGKAYELSPVDEAELMRTRYCIRYELGICPRHHGNKQGARPEAKTNAPLLLANNGKFLEVQFDCRNCEMTVKARNMANDR